MREIVVQMYCQKCHKEVFPKDVNIREFMIAGMCDQCRERDE